VAWKAVLVLVKEEGRVPYSDCACQDTMSASVVEKFMVLARRSQAIVQVRIGAACSAVIELPMMLSSPCCTPKVLASYIN
jgi:hypothetical protein